MNKKTKIVLTISVLFNVLLIGIIIGHMSNRIVRGGGPQKNIERAFENGEISKESKETIKNSLEGLRKENRVIFKDIKKQRKEIKEILSAEYFDEEEYASAVDKMHTMHGKIVDNMKSTVIDLAKELPPENRSVLADVFKKPHRGGRKGSPQHEGRRPPPPNDM